VAELMRREPILRWNFHFSGLAGAPLFECMRYQLIATNDETFLFFSVLCIRFPIKSLDAGCDDQKTPNIVRLQVLRLIDKLDLILKEAF
jgi:hypothetical protein